jgi:hypothetical protein
MLVWNISLSDESLAIYASVVLKTHLRLYVLCGTSFDLNQTSLLSNFMKIHLASPELLHALNTEIQKLVRAFLQSLCCENSLPPPEGNNGWNNIYLALSMG